MKLLKNQIQNPGSDLGQGGRHVPCGILVARLQVLECGVLAAWPGLRGSGVSPCDGVRPRARFLSTYRGTLQWAPFSLPGCLALEFLELSVVQFLNLQDQQGGRERWKPREQGQLRLETCH